MQEEIGSAAGMIWHTLDAKGELSLAQLKKEVNGKTPIFDWCRSPKFRPPAISTRYGVAFHKQTAIAIAHDRHLQTPARHGFLPLPRASNSST